MLALTFSPSAQVYSVADYQKLWGKAESAIEEGKPQTAVGYLNELESMTQTCKDTLEQYKVMRRKYECLSKYNWKEANAYYPKFNALHRQITGNLDYYIEKYANHPSVDWLIYEKVSKIKRETDASRSRNGQRYSEIRQMCIKAVELFPKSAYRKDFMQIVENMDAVNAGISCKKSFIYPGQTLDFELTGRNIEESELLIYRFNDRYTILTDDPLKHISGNASLVSKQRISSYKCDYNMAEKVAADYCFGDPGVYLVANSAQGKNGYVIVYVSRLVLATRQVGGRNEVYVADGLSGKPYQSATVYAWSDAHELGENQNLAFVKSKFLSQKNYSLNGFTALNQEIFSKAVKSAQIAAGAGEDKWGPLVGISEASAKEQARKNAAIHYIYTDRTLYRASDTVQFKLIAVSTNYETGKVLSGKKITVNLYAPSSSKPAAKLTLTTNSMGSAAGKFTIPSGGKNGEWRIETDKGSAWFSVAAYKDPKYKIEFEQIKDIYTFDEPLTQIGRVKGYTGEGMPRSRIEYKVENLYFRAYGKGTVIAEGDGRTDDDGFFEVPFMVAAPDDPNISSAAYRITVKSVAKSGETTESSKVVRVSRNALSFDARFDNEYRMDTLLLVNKDKARTLTITASNSDSVEQQIQGWYRLEKDGLLCREGAFTFGDPIEMDLPAMESGEYELKYGANLSGGTQSETTTLALLSPDDRTCPVKRQMFFYPVQEKDAVDFMIGTADQDLYLEVEVFDGDKVVYRKPLHLSREAQHIKLDYKSTWKDEVTVSVFGIKYMEEISRRHNFGRSVSSYNIEIKVSSLRDRTTPNTKETFTVEAKPSEMLVSIYDVTCDRYRKNSFYFQPVYPYSSRAPYVVTNLSGQRLYYNVRTAGKMLAKGAAPQMDMMAVNDAAMVEEEAVAFSRADGAAASGTDDIDIRDDFSQTLAFIPQLSIPASGKAKVTFTTREGLSTFRIAMLAHTKNLSSGFAEREIVVNKAVKIESFAPLFAVEGDRLIVKANVSNTGQETASGKASLRLSDEADGIPLDIYPADLDLTLKPGTSQVVSWELKIPKNVRKIGLTTVFASKKFSDAEKHLMEIVPASSTITEAESFVVGSYRNKNSCIRDLKARFPYPNPEIRYEEYSTKEALKEVLKQPAYPKGDNMIEWVNALYINQMRGCLLGVDSVDVSLSRRAVTKLAALQKSDGGFGWFPCNSSSDLLTMMFLDKAYYMREVGALPRNTNINKVIEKALGYVEKRILEKTSSKKWEWRDLTYLFAARVVFPDTPMSADIRKVLQEYVRKCKSGWQDIPIVEKARLCMVLDATDTRQMLTVMRSLRDYAVRNDNVGCYFPNAAMPCRGMLYNELYAHSLLAVIFGEMEQMDIAKGIMKWLLLQKHNQQWDSNMASADAIFPLLKYRAPDLKFGAVFYTYRAPMLDVKESQNQLSVKRSWWRNGKQLRDGDKLRVGDKIEVRYDIYNTENRSFVVMEASRPACFYPEDERSWGSQWFYVERVADRTKYYFQTLAEEDTHLKETFFVTQEGVFNSALVTIESLYAPEYRGHTGAFTVETEE